MTAIDLEGVVTAAGLIGLRVGGLMLFAPFFSNQSILPQVKVTLTVLLTVLLYPAMHLPMLHLTLAQLLPLAMSEMIVGLLLGLAVTAVFDAAQLAGYVLSIQMGFSLASMFDPTTQADTPIISVFYQTMTMLIFLRMDVHYWLLRGVAHSFSYLPPGTATLHGAAVGLLMQQASGIFLAGIQIAAPVLAATMIADLTLGFIGRASPQLPVMMIGLSVKTVLGVTVIIATLAMWPTMLEHYFGAAVSTGERLMHLSQ
jgi:flagellar biosynthetic protein FliR